MGDQNEFDVKDVMDPQLRFFPPFSILTKRKEGHDLFKSSRNNTFAWRHSLCYMVGTSPFYISK